MINKPVPIVKRMTGTNGFLKRTRLTSISRARVITALIALLLALKRAAIDKSTADATGETFRGERPGLFCVAGSIYRRMNHRANHPGVIASTGPVRSKGSASLIG